MKHVTACNHIGLHARLRAQHASHVLGMRANDGGSGFIPMFGNPTASRHGNPGIGFLSFRFLLNKSIPSPQTLRGTLLSVPL
jgi:hypothetical protein